MTPLSPERFRRRARALVAFAMLVVSLACLPPPAAADTGGDGRYAGSDKCTECHEDEALALNSTAHGRAGFAKLSAHGCETCHGPSAAHAEKPQDAKLYPTHPAKLSKDEQSKSCRGCHDGGAHALWDGSPHETRGVSCLDCHSVHSPVSADAQLKEATEMETCFQCHKQIRLEIRKPSHHPIREGELGCSDCHNPHGSTTEKLLTAESLNDQCYECHTEKRGPFLWEHAPVRESCANCHTPHGSNHQKLQTTSTPYLCQQCHSNTRHPGTLYDASTLPTGSRASNREFNRSCANCHAAIHGSNHPSGPYLGR